MKRVVREFRHDITKQRPFSFEMPKGSVILGVWFGPRLGPVTLLADRNVVDAIMIALCDPDAPTEPRGFVLLPIDHIIEIPEPFRGELVPRGAYQLPPQYGGAVLALIEQVSQSGLVVA